MPSWKTLFSVGFISMLSILLLAVTINYFGWFSDDTTVAGDTTSPPTSTNRLGFVKVIKVNGEKIISIPPRHCVDISEPFQIKPTSKSHSNSGKARIIGHGEAEVYYYSIGHPLYNDCVNDAKKLDRKKPTVDVDWEEAHHVDHDWEE